MITFFKALRIRYKLLKGEAVSTSESMPLALRYRWLFDNKWLYSPSIRVMLAVHDAAEAFEKEIKKASSIEGEYKRLSGTEQDASGPESRELSR